MHDIDAHKQIYLHTFVQTLHGLFVGIPVNFVHPLLHVVEGLLICHVVDDDDAYAHVRACTYLK